MATGGFLYQLAAAGGVVAAVILLYAVLKALWAEIGPMVALLFRRDRMVALQEDEEISRGSE
jgi:hypothetical protein